MDIERPHRELAVFGLLVALLAGCGVSGAQSDGDPTATPDLRFDQIQVLGSHNSYKQAITPRLLERYRALRPEGADALDYWHPPLSAQLDHGLRKLELDVFYDPEGGRYAHPGGLDWAPEEGAASAAMFDLSHSLAAPGFKVLHVQDLDFRSNCPTLVACLLELRTWSRAHPGHLPVLVTMNTKDDVIEREGYVTPLPFDEAAFDALDAEIPRALGRERLLVPDDVRRGYDSLAAALEAEGWPPLDEVRGRFLFVLDQGGEKRDAYLAKSPTLAGRVLFVDVAPPHPAAAIRILNDPEGDADEIRESVQAGLLVRTRADANTREARAGTTTRREAAFASGAHFVSTDYYLPEQQVGTDYLVTLPGGEGGVARCNPLTTEAPCRIQAAPGELSPPKLIAHRGGVVDASRPENSRAALEAAVAAGYWMIEIDLRESRDGTVVVNHDADFQRIYGDGRELAAMTREEIEALRMETGGEPPMLLDELVELASGRLRLMLDWKTRSPRPDAFARLADRLEKADLLATAYVIGTPEARAHFLGRAKVSADLDAIEEAAAAGEDVGQRYFLFAHGRDLTALDLQRAAELGVEVVPSINLFHYADLEAPEAAARHDLERLRRMGVVELQIDSVYADWLR